MEDRPSLKSLRGIAPNLKPWNPEKEAEKYKRAAERLAEILACYHISGRVSPGKTYNLNPYATKDWLSWALKEEDDDGESR